MVKNCKQCMKISAAPRKTPTTPWKPQSRPCSRVHIDVAGPIEGKHFLIMVDATTKWLEVKKMSSTNSVAVIKEMRRVYVTFGLPCTIVSDNGTASSFEEIKNKNKINVIKFLYIAPYNLQAKLKQSKWCKRQKNSLNKLIEGDWDLKLARLLFKQHTAPSSPTGKNPAEGTFGRKLRTVLDKLKPSMQNTEDADNESTSIPTIQTLTKGTRGRLMNNRVSGPKWTIYVI